jgi:hypothetical protein
MSLLAVFVSCRILVLYRRGEKKGDAWVGYDTNWLWTSSSSRSERSRWVPRRVDYFSEYFILYQVDYFYSMIRRIMAAWHQIPLLPIKMDH